MRKAQGLVHCEAINICSVLGTSRPGCLEERSEEVPSDRDQFIVRRMLSRQCLASIVILLARKDGELSHRIPQFREAPELPPAD
jgi:hypothetical protein